MKLKYQIFLFFCLNAFSFSAFPQEELRMETINGKKYYIHQVEPGHTLYAISKKYLVEVPDIIRENPQAGEGLKVGQEIRIPVIKENRKLHKANNPEIEGNFILHQVEQGQTLYNLSKQYNIDIADIVAENPGVQNSMQVGQIIKIPVSKVQNVKKESLVPASSDGWKKHIVSKSETAYSLARRYNVNIDSLNQVNNYFPNGLREGDTINIPIKVPDVYGYVKEKLRPDSLPFVLSPYKEFNVAIFLPLFLDENDAILANKKPFEKESIYPQSAIGLQFYEGMLVALDSLKKSGFKANVYVYDTGRDSAQLKSLLQKPEFEKMDLIIGPLYLSGFSIAANFAKIRNIPIVSPFVQQTNILTNNPFVLKSLPAPATQFEQLALYLKSYYSGQNIIMVHNAVPADLPMGKAFSAKMKEGGYNVKEIVYSSAGFSGVNAALSPSLNNIIVVPSNDQVFITDLVTKLYFSAAENDITLFGTDNWLNFDNIDLNYLHKLNAHLPLLTFIDYGNERVKDFIRKYREEYFTDPSSFSFQGFDVGMFYLELLDRHGKEFVRRGNLRHQGLQVNFNQEKIAEDSGFENKSIIIVKYDDFRLKRVN